MAYGGGYDWDTHTRKVLMEGTQAMERTAESIDRSQRIAIETEQIGTGVLSDLGEQREALLRTQDRIDNMNENVSQSNRIITAMNRHVLYNKFLLITIILLESGILIGLLYIKLSK